MDEAALLRLRSSSISRPVPVPTEQDCDAYIGQLRSLGADEPTIARLTERIRRGQRGSRVRGVRRRSSQQS